MLDANALHISLALEGVSTDLQVLSFVGREALNQPFRFDIELVSHRPDLELEALLHKPGCLTFGAAGTGIIHGLVYRIEQSDSGKKLTRYSVSLVPQLAYLQHNHDQQIFQHLTVPQIIAQVLEARGILADAYDFQLGVTYPPREYCVQYDESDLHFIQRLCEEEGIHFHFQHAADGHTLVFGDDQTVFRKLADVRYQQDSGMAAEQPVIKRFGLRLETRTTRVSRRDYDFEKPAILPEGSATRTFEPDLEDYDYPGRFTDRARGKQLATRALERHRSDYQLVEGQGDEPTLVSGHFMTLAEHPRSEWNDLWLLLEVIHEGKQPQVLGETITSDVTENKGDFHQGYRNRFLATPWDAHYRPPLLHLKPKALGSQTAIVTGPLGDEIHCDQYGRVKVQFHWDREGQADDKTSCWVRVASGWAGSAYGGIAIPRIGMEVLITFLEGDPDQPLITGCLYHKENVVPYDLTAHKTRSTFKTLSSPGGKGYNELRIEDRKGAEQIYLHAQRDWDEDIEHDQKIRIGNERHDTVEANVYSEFKAEEHRITHLDRKSEVRADDYLSVANTQHVKVGTGQFVEAGNEIHYHAGNKVVIEAGMELTAKGGGSFIKLDPGGVTLSGANIKINSGGAPGKGSGTQILGPVTLGAADADKPGSTLQQALFIPHQLGTSSSAIDTVIQKDLHSLPAGAATAQAIPSPLVQTGSLSFVPAAQSDSGPGKWVTQEIDYDGISNTLKMFTNRLGSLGDEGRVFGSEGKDYQHTTRRMIQEWMPLDESEQHLAVNSAINIYGQRREIAQRYLEGDDNWQLSGKSWHWQPLTASTVYEQKDKQQ